MTTLFVCGDVVNQGNDTGLICSEELAKIITDADYSICNFEAPIEGLGEAIPKSGGNLNQRKVTISGLRKQGFNLLCMANNHIMDYGREALDGTINEAKENDLDVVGVGNNFDEAYKPLIKEIDGLKIGIINACEAQFGVLDYFAKMDQPGYAWINHNKIDVNIMELKKECDFVIVLAHAGLEYFPIPQKEWRYRYKHFCDLGADVVIGSHPHVPQGVEAYQDSFIFYSLGNFYFNTKNHRHKEQRTYSILLELTKDKGISYSPIFHHRQDGQVHLSPDEKKTDLDQLTNYLQSDYQEPHDDMSLKAILLTRFYLIVFRKKKQILSCLREYQRPT